MRRKRKVPLTIEAVPYPDSDWSTINQFAGTFDGYRYCRSPGGCGQMANDAAQTYLKTHDVPETLPELRSCLFFEQRRSHHYGGRPNMGKMTYIRALIRAIREKVLSGETE